MNSKTGKHLVVVYHDSCIDGAASAWVLHQKWGQEPGTVITYVSYAHHKTAESEKEVLSALKPGHALYFVDIAPSTAFLDKLLSPDPSGAQRLASVYILDHHQTAATELANYAPPVIKGFTAPPLTLQIDENCPSASCMIWQALLPDRPLPPFFEVIDKMDRGDGLISTDDFSAAALIDSKRTTSIKDAFNACSTLSQLSAKEMAEKGQDILADQKIRIEKLGGNVMSTEIDILPGTPAVKVPIINASVQDFGRSIANYLSFLGRKSGTGLAFAWHVEGNGTVTMSIVSEGAPDASKVAEHFCKKMGITGGGHKNRAAVHFPSLQHFWNEVTLQPLDMPPPARALLPSRRKPPGQKPL